MASIIIGCRVEVGVGVAEAVAVGVAVAVAVSVRVDASVEVGAAPARAAARGDNSPPHADRIIATANVNHARPICRIVFAS
jgi:hypothetical protein